MQAKPVFKANAVLKENLNAGPNSPWTFVYSDHLPQIMPIMKGIEVLIWNIMTRGKASSRGTNNGFHKHESLPEYQERLERIGQAIALLVEHNPHLAILALQEAPDNKAHRQLLLAKVKQQAKNREFAVFYQQSLGNPDFGLLTLCCEQKIQAKSTPTKRLTTQKGRVLSLDMQLSDLPETPSFLFVNVHLKYKEKTAEGPFSVTEVQQEIDILLDSSPGQVVIAGDFNKDLTSFYSKEANTIYQEDSCFTSFSYDGNANKQKGQNIDGFIFKFNPSK